MAFQTQGEGTKGATGSNKGADKSRGEDSRGFTKMTEASHGTAPRLPRPPRRTVAAFM